MYQVQALPLCSSEGEVGLELLHDFRPVFALQVLHVDVDIRISGCFIHVARDVQHQEENAPSLKIHLAGLVGAHGYVLRYRLLHTNKLISI